MAAFKCKMCGGTLEINNNETVAVCEYCGTKQTLPKSNDETVSNLFNRANNLRLKCEFDKAEQAYEKILDLDNTESEAHWGIVLCKYGIEYVEDPKTYTRVPTCHRTSYDAILADTDYLAALANADTYQKHLYEEEAKKINTIQHDILSIVKNESPFDVFICYKETDESGKRTLDSTIANDIYYQLTNEGYKVFYAALTLEDKIGEAYEPYIFAALNSAKVMLVIGTKPEYFEAVWVKNEWSRFLKSMKNNRSKLLIPCYRDMDAYDLPEEFAHLQSQDMGKIGFINDIVHGIKKVLVKEAIKSEPMPIEQGTQPVTRVDPLLKRASLFLEDGDFESADAYYEKVLDADPENARAYLGKTLTAFHLRKTEQLSNLQEEYFRQKDYQKAERFADEQLKATLAQCRTAWNENHYNFALSSSEKAKSPEEFKNAALLFNKLGDYKDAKRLFASCLEQAENIEKQIAKRNQLQADIHVKKTEIAELQRKKQSLIAQCNAEKDKVEKAVKVQKGVTNRLFVLAIFNILSPIVLFMYILLSPEENLDLQASLGLLLIGVMIACFIAFLVKWIKSNKHLMHIDKKSFLLRMLLAFVLPTASYIMAILDWTKRKSQKSPKSFDTQYQYLQNELRRCTDALTVAENELQQMLIQAEQNAQFAEK